MSIAMIDVAHGVAFATLIGLLVAIAIVDVRRFIIPDTLNAALAGIGVAVAIFVEGRSAAMVLFEASFCLIAGVALAWGYRQLRGRSGLGLGDIKFLAAATTWTGLAGIPWVLLIGSLSGLAVVASAQLAGRPITASSRLPFGPYLSLGLIMVWASRVFSPFLP